MQKFEIMLMPQSKKKPFQFEKALSELEQLIETMESSDLTLEAALTAFESGVSLTKQCQQALQAAELKIEQLIEENGEIATQTFDEDDVDE